MNPISIEGSWWLPGDDEQVAGELSFDGDQLTLNLERGLGFGGEQSLILGTEGSRPVTLVEAQSFFAGVRVEPQSAWRFINRRWIAGRAYLGLHLTSVRDEAFLAYRLELSGLSQWASFGATNALDEVLFRAAIEEGELAVIEPSEADATEGQSFRVVVEYRFAHPIDPDSLWREVACFWHLQSLTLRETVTLSDVWVRSPSGLWSQLLFPTHASTGRNMANPPLFDLSSTQRAWRLVRIRWQQHSAVLARIIQAVGAGSRGAPFVEAGFALLSFAAEWAHRMIFPDDAEFTAFERRLNRLLGLLPAHSRRLLSVDQQMVEQLAATRHWVVHGNDKYRRSALTSPQDMYRACGQLQLLICAALMAWLGFSPEDLNSGLARQPEVRRRWFARNASEWI